MHNVIVAIRNVGGPSGFEIWTWGQNTDGNLGDLTLIDKSSPVQVAAGSTDWAHVDAPIDDQHAAAVKTDGTLWMWGANNQGQLGIETTDRHSSPIQVGVNSDWAIAECGGSFTAAIKTDNTLWTWGSNTSGRLGDNTTVRKSSPIQTIAGGNNWAKLSCGKAHMAAIKTDGSLWVWGSNTNGLLGDNTTVNKSSPVQTIIGGTIWDTVSSGDTHMAAIKTDGTLWSWGTNFNGQMGDNTTTHKSSPIQTIASGTDWDQLSCGERRTVTIKTDGTLWLWGANFDGELGDNTVVSKSSPIQTITGGTDWEQCSTSYRHTAAIKTGGTLWTWGDNFFGQLGDATTFDKSSPIQVGAAGGDVWVQVSCGGTWMAARKQT